MAIDFRRVKFFVEGTGDRVFLRDFLSVFYNQPFSKEQLKELIIPCGGFTNLEKFSKEFKEIDTKREGGVNIVIFDADYDGREEHHGYANKKAYLEKQKETLKIDFHAFLFPSNQEGQDGTLETFLESCVHPQHQEILNCWRELENCVEKHEKYTIPANKSKMYFYLECLCGKTNAEKDKIKDPNRDFTQTDKWILDYDKNKNVKNLKDFLDKLLLA